MKSEEDRYFLLPPVPFNDLVYLRQENEAKAHFTLFVPQKPLST